MQKFLIVVPATNAFGIDIGSAMVTPESAEPTHGDRVMVHYESNRMGASNMHRFVEKCLHAAGRASVNYPTIAKSALLMDDLKVVGKFDLQSKTITEISDPDALRAWAGEIGDLSC